MGGLDAAVRFAANKAGLGANYRLVEFPRKKEFAEALQELVEKMAPNNARVTTGVAGQIMSRFEAEMSTLSELGVCSAGSRSATSCHSPHCAGSR